MKAITKERETSSSKMITMTTSMLCVFLTFVVTLLVATKASAADLLTEMTRCALLESGNGSYIREGYAIEAIRNSKIEEEGLDFPKTYFFREDRSRQDIIDDIICYELKEDYAVAGEVYERLHKAGFADPQISGILGNMMAECGGQTLDLDYDLYGGGRQFYGLCMWSLYFGPDVKDRNVAGQIDYMLHHSFGCMEYQMNYSGSYDRFLSLTDPAQCARYFCQHYERGAGAYQRAINAQAAYKWITETRSAVLSVV